ncbi:hypothetical protein TgHK011_000890 [Trichoderma gracile]|nr:hypothetical protein TgHK011_000890 [Trichoderma gracile]
MRRPPRPRISGPSLQSASATASRIRTANISGTSAITSRRSRARTRSHSSRLLAQKHRRSSPSSSSRFYSDLASLIESAAQESSSIIGISRAPQAKAMSAQGLSVPWDRLKQWIAEQESAEQQGLKPPMTKPQLAALSHIVKFVDPEPDVSDQDYVSLLMQYTQAKRYPAPSFTDQGLDVPVEGNFVIRWRTTCHLDESAAVVRGQKGSKAIRRQTRIGISPVSIIVNNPPPLRRRSPTPSRPSCGKGPEQERQQQLSRDSAEFYSGKLPSLLEQVASEAKRLNFGCPEYKIYDDPNKKGCYAGYPVFQNGGRMPSDIGHVAGAISRNVAKEQIAGALLDFLKKESDKRQALQRQVMGTFGGPPAKDV